MGTRVTHHGVLPDVGTGKIQRFEPGVYQTIGAAGPRVEVLAEHRLIEAEHGPSIVHHPKDQGAARATPARVDLHTGSFVDPVTGAPVGKAGETYEGGGGSKLYIHPAAELAAPPPPKAQDKELARAQAGDDVGRIEPADADAGPATPRERKEVVLPPVELDEPPRQVPPDEAAPEPPAPGEREGDDRFEGKQA